MHIVLQLANVRLATSCTSMVDLLTVLIFDWVTTVGIYAPSHHSSQRALSQSRARPFPSALPWLRPFGSGAPSSSTWPRHQRPRRKGKARSPTGCFGSRSDVIPPLSRGRYPACVRTLLYVQTFDKMNPKQTTFRRFSTLSRLSGQTGHDSGSQLDLGTTGYVQLHDLRRYEYLLENAALTMCCESHHPSHPLVFSVADSPLAPHHACVCQTSPPSLGMCGTSP
jgi:hypothetical protein